MNIEEHINSVLQALEEIALNIEKLIAMLIGMREALEVTKETQEVGGESNGKKERSTCWH